MLALHSTQHAPKPLLSSPLLSSPPCFHSPSRFISVASQTATRLHTDECQKPAAGFTEAERERRDVRSASADNTGMNTAHYSVAQSGTH